MKESVQRSRNIPQNLLRSDVCNRFDIYNLFTITATVKTAELFTDICPPIVTSAVGKEQRGDLDL